MSTIFISPLLWKRFNRAVRRREEGQALVLVALAAVALVAIVGLSVDGGMTYMEAQKLQRAADSAALAGVVWVPSQPVVADARGRLSVQSEGYNAFFQNGNQQASYSYDQVMNNPPGTYVAYWGSVVNAFSYKVVLGEKVPRYFLGVLGFGDYYVQREATAMFATPARLGGSFNYFGSQSMKYDWVIRDKAVQGDEYYKTLWNRYIGARCDQTNRPDPCVGTFWLTIQGPDTNHASGDAYTAIGDGATAVNSGGPYTNSVDVPGGVGYPNGCTRNNDFSTWAGTQSWWFTVGGSGCNFNANNPDVVNKDRHPDSDGAQGFGYSIAVQVDKAALYPYTGDPTKPYTSLRVSVYDAAMSDVGSGEIFGTGDNYWGTSSPYGARPYDSFNSAADANRKVVYDSRTSADKDTINCNTSGLPAVASNGQSRRENGQIITGGAVTAADQYCQNGMRTRFSLYYPPASDGTPTTWRTKGGLVAAFDAEELTVQNELWDTNFGGGLPAGGGSQYCYFADAEVTGTATAINNDPTPQDPTTKLVYACPANAVDGGTSSTSPDFYWNAYPLSTNATSYANRVQNINDAGTATPDPSQSCRSMVDTNLYTNSTEYNNALSLNQSVAIPPPYRGVRIPYNMRGADPVWTGPDKVYSTRTGTYTGGYQSYHGWRCAWDFDSSNTLNPGPNNTGIGVQDSLRDDAEGINNQPYLFISDYGYVNGGSTIQRIKYANGQRLAGTVNDPTNVRNGVYLLQVQTFGGGATNRYGVKVEYDNPQPVTYTFQCTNAQGQVSPCNKTFNPVPQVYGITAMAIYVNAVNNTTAPLNVIFDLAYIPPENADSLATLELWDSGDVGTSQLSVEILTPSGYGQQLKSDGSVPYDPTTQRLSARPVACPMQYNPNPAVPCAYGSVSNVSTTIKNGNAYFNDQWLFLIFRVPNQSTYDQWTATCNTQKVPNNLCYYYQINYKLAGSGSASDTTTWQLSIRNQPVHLVQ